MNKFTTTLLTAATAGILSTSAIAADYNFKFQSSDPAGDKNFQVQKEWTQRVETMTGGRVHIDLLPVGSIFKHTETLDGIKMGILDGQITATEFFSGKDPAFGLIGNTVGAWSNTQQLLQYVNYGGGYELMNELYAPYGVKFIGGIGYRRYQTRCWHWWYDVPDVLPFLVRERSHHDLRHVARQSLPRRRQVGCCA